MSIQPGEIQVPRGSSVTRSSAVTTPPSTVTRTACPSSAERPRSERPALELARSLGAEVVASMVRCLSAWVRMLSLEAGERDPLDDPPPEDEECDERRQHRYDRTRGHHPEVH